MKNLAKYKADIIDILECLTLDINYTNLILGTTAVESDFGSIRRQRGLSLQSKIGGFGINQIELATHDWIRHDWFFVTKNEKISNYLKEIYTNTDSLIENLMYNDIYNTAICILKYKSCAHLFPKDTNFDNVKELAYIWKKFYNTYLGKGKEEDFIKKYNKYVLKDEKPKEQNTQ